MLHSTKVQELVNLFVNENYNPSISMTIYDNGKYESFNAGYADLENKKAATENTIYAIGSSTKAFAAEALCILADRGVISLDTPIIEYLPNFAMYDTHATAALTVRDILCHRCGLPRHDLTWFANADYEKRDELIHNIRYLKPFTTLRNKWYYQNHMFVLAGYLIEKVSGLKWDDFVQKEILEPLGLCASFKISELAKDPEMSKNYSVTLADGTVNPSNYRDIYHVGAAGCINSTTKDMAKWVALQLNDGKVGDKQIISSELLKECHTPQMVIQHDPAMPKFSEISHKSYGLGWFVENYRGRTLVHHGGNIDGYSAMHFFVPGTGFGASILTNCEGTPIQNSLMYSLIDLYFDYDPVDWLGRYKNAYIDLMKKGEEAIGALVNSATKDTKPSLPLEKYAAIYSNPGYGDIKIAVVDGTLEAAYGDLDFKLEHLCFDSFLMKFGTKNMTVPAQFGLSLTGEGLTFSAKLEPALEDMIVFKKK